MNSLKKKDLKSKFGKFAVSTEKMAKVNGGNGHPGGDVFFCWGIGGEQSLQSYTLSEAISAVNSGSVDGCSN